MLPPRPAAPIGLALGGAVPRPIAGAKASAPPAPLSSRPASPAPVQGPITIHPTSAPLTPHEKARVETLVTQVDVTDAIASPTTIPETVAAHPVGTIPDLVPAPLPILTPVTPFVLHTPPPATVPEPLPPIVVVPVARAAARPAPVPRTVAPAPQSSPKRAPAASPSKPAPIPQASKSKPAPALSALASAPAASVGVPVPLSSVPPPVVVPVAPISSAPASANASNKIASPWRVVSPAIPGAVPSPVPWGAPLITPAPSSASDLASCDLKVDDSRNQSLISFSDLSGLAREPMRSDANSSGSIVLGDPVIRQKMMSVVAARRRRFTGVVFSAVALCAVVCAAAVAGSVSAAEEASSGDIVVRGLSTAKEELIVPQHKAARRHF